MTYAKLEEKIIEDIQESNRKQQRIESQFLKNPTTAIVEKVSEEKGYRRGLKRALSHVSQERDDNELPLTWSGELRDSNELPLPGVKE